MSKGNDVPLSVSCVVSTDRRRLLAASAVGVSALVLPRAAAASSVGNAGNGGLAPMGVVSAQYTNCNSFLEYFELEVVLVDDGNYDIRFSISGGAEDDWLLPFVANYGDGWEEKLWLKYQIADPQGCDSTTLTAIRNTPTVVVGRFVNGALESVSAPLTVV